MADAALQANKEDCYRFLEIYFELVNLLYLKNTRSCMYALLP